jgi:uncharacterized protein
VLGNYYKKVDIMDIISNKKWHRRDSMVTINQAQNMFYVGEDVKEPIAELTFNQSSGNNIVVDHTYVSDELRGQGVAGKLVEKVVAYARENEKKIIPLCPYVKRKLEENAEYHDVLSEK